MRLGRRVYDYRLLGFNFMQVTERMNEEAVANGQPTWTHQYYRKCYNDYTSGLDPETKDQLRDLVMERTDFIYQSLVKGVAKGNARSAEVALQALKAIREMTGLDADKNANPAALQQQAITIQITPHPGDERAVKLVEAHQSQPAALQPPTSSPLLEEANNRFGRWNGVGEDVDSAPVGLESASRSDDGED